MNNSLTTKMESTKTTNMSENREKNVSFRKYASILLDTINHIEKPSAGIISMRETVVKYLTCDSETYWENINTFNDIIVPFMKDHIELAAGKKATHGSVLMELGGVPGQLIDKKYRQTSMEDEFLPFKYCIATAYKKSDGWNNDINVISDNKADFFRVVHRITNQLFNTTDNIPFTSSAAYTKAKSDLTEYSGKKTTNPRKTNELIDAMNSLFKTFYFVRDQRTLTKIAERAGKSDLTSINIIEKFSGGVSLNICQTSVVTNAGYDFFSLDFEKNLAMKIIIAYMNTSFDQNVVGISIQPSMIMNIKSDGKPGYDLGMRVRFYINDQIVSNLTGENLKSKIEKDTVEVSNVIASFIIHSGMEFDDGMLKRIIKPSPQKLYLVGNTERKI